MMDMRYEIRMQHYQSLLREAEERRLARDLGMPDHPDLGLLRPVSAGLWAWLSQIISPEITSSDEALIPGTRQGG